MDLQAGKRYNRGMILRKPAARFVLWYLRALAKIQLSKINPVVIGIGGASGKSSTCSLVAASLSSKFKVKAGKGKNSETGVPLDILGINPGNYTFLDWVRIILTAKLQLLINWNKYDIYVAEMGIDGPNEPKNMSYLLKIVKPKIAALTNITWEHSLYFDEAIKEDDEEKRADKILARTAEEEIKLLTSLGLTDTAVINLDDRIVASYLHDIKAKKMTISTYDKNADFYAEISSSNLNSFEMNVTSRGRKYKFSLDFPLPPHYAHTFLLSIAIANSQGILVESAIKSLTSGFSLPPGRFSIFKGIKETTIIDSSYNNATIVPIEDILDFVATSNAKRKVGVLGDMRELGSITRQLHERLAGKIAENLDVAFLIGDAMSEFVVPILKKKNKKIYAFRTFSEAKDSILKNIESGDLILVKGSQNKLFLERAVEILLKDKKDTQKLVRRGEFWDNKRKETL